MEPETISMVTKIIIGFAFILIAVGLFIVMYPHLETGIFSGFLKAMTKLFSI
ncbi:MAG: hypothetical protein KJ906_00285 [Nanoarchaeota archaeon]|nr:hypothetical protein [Nanoarchaeota archaeon]